MYVCLSVCARLLPFVTSSNRIHFKNIIIFTMCNCIIIQKINLMILLLMFDKTVCPMYLFRTVCHIQDALLSQGVSCFINCIRYGGTA